MTDGADDLILQMQHLAASAAEALKARAGDASAQKLSRASHKVAAAAQEEVAKAEAMQAQGAEKLAAARVPGTAPLAAAELYTEGKRLAEQGKVAAIKARAKLNFALDAMDEADRRAWEALQAEARAEAHSQLGGVAAGATPGPAAGATPGPAAGATAGPAPEAGARATTDLTASAAELVPPPGPPEKP